MTKQEIINRLKEMLEKPALEVQKEVRLMEKEYKKIWTEEFEKAKQLFIDEGGKAKDFVYHKSKEDEEVAELIIKFNKKKEAEEKELDNIREKNKKKKEDLLKQLEALADADIKDITAIIKKLKEIQSEWKSIKEIKKADYAELQRKYNLLSDKISENIKAFDALQQYDLQKNTELKEELLNKFEQLLNKENIKEIEELFRAYRKEWRRIGSVVNEKYPEIKTRFIEINKKIKERIKQFYSALEDEKKNNLEQKKLLIDELKKVIEPISNKGKVIWKDVNEKVQQIKSKWEKIGHIPAEFIKNINGEYNSLLDIYYDAKRKHQEIIQQKQEEIRGIKERILNEIEKLKDSEDIEQAYKTVIRLQQEWKKYYLRNKEENDKLNQQFKTYCDNFFERKKSAEKEKLQVEKDNLVKKLELINRLKETSFDKNNTEDVLLKIQEFIKEWNNIGYVPIEEKDRINDEFYGKINQIYAELGLSEEKRHIIQYKMKLQEIIHSASHPIDALTKEEKFIKRKITELENEITQIENNLAFFKTAQPDNPLLKETYHKKEKINSYISEWKSKLNVLQSTLGELKKKQASV